MSVSSTFFDAVKAYSNSRVETTLGNTVVPSRAWQYHPLNWDCNDLGPFSSCFRNTNVAEQFFEQLLKPLESHYGNCKQEMPTSRYTWICPSNHDPNDALSLHVHPDRGMGFESTSKISGKCWVGPQERRVSSFEDDQRSFTCEALNFLEKTDHLLRFEVKAFASGKISHVTEYTKEGEEIGTISGVGFSFLEKDQAIDSPLQFSYRIQQSEYLQSWQGDLNKNGLMKAFAALTTSEPASFIPISLSTTHSPTPIPAIEPFSCPVPEPVSCPPCANANSNNGLIIGVVAIISVVSALVLLRNKRNKAHTS